MLSNDDLLWIILIAGALGIYALEMTFFWVRWKRLSLHLSEEGEAMVRVQALQAEVEIMAAELLSLRRHLQRQAEAGGGHVPPMSVPMSGAEREVRAAMEKEKSSPIKPSVLHTPTTPAKKASAAPAPVRSSAQGSGGASRPSNPSPEYAHSRHAPSSDAERARSAQSPSFVPEMPFPYAKPTGNTAREPEVLHRKVIELARKGLNSAAIATECQLSQTEAELILSLNGIKRS